MSQKLTDIFNKYVGREILVEKLPNSNDWGSPQPNQQVLEDIGTVAHHLGYDVRIKLPHLYYDTANRTDRINVNVDQDKQGTWRIKGFSIG